MNNPELARIEAEEINNLGRAIEALDQIDAYDDMQTVMRKIKEVCICWKIYIDD